MRPQLCVSLERMTNAYIDKYAKLEGNPGAPHIATGVTANHKTMSPDEIEGMVSRWVAVWLGPVGIDNK